jgi:hypothetical protein
MFSINYILAQLMVSEGIFERFASYVAIVKNERKLRWYNDAWKLIVVLVKANSGRASIFTHEWSYSRLTDYHVELSKRATLH